MAIAGVPASGPAGLSTMLLHDVNTLAPQMKMAAVSTRLIIFFKNIVD
jgi:hypothetical protein